MTDNVVSAASYSGAAVSVIAGLTMQEWGIFFGIVTAVLTLTMNAVYQHRRDRRSEREHRERMSRYRDGGSV